jgi:hypothetical protein
MSTHSLERHQSQAGLEVVGSNAPEMSRSQHAPERHFVSSDLQVVYSNSPLMVDYAEGKELDQSRSKSDGKVLSSLRILRRGWLIACTITIFIAIALGVGLGVGLTRKSEGSSLTRYGLLHDRLNF